MPKHARWIVFASFIFAACASNDSASESDSNAISDAGDTSSVGSPDAVTDSGGEDAASAELEACSDEEVADIPVERAGFAVQSADSCAPFAASASAQQGTIVSVDESSLVVELAGGASLEFANWRGPALNTFFAGGESVEVAAPCSYAWSVVRGPQGAVAALKATPMQYWRQPVELAALPEFIADAPSFELDPQCRMGSRFYNALEAASSKSDATASLATPGTEQLGDWSVAFGGSEWCCRASSDSQNGEPPETRTALYLYRSY
jgi:hypothetical protein